MVINTERFINKKLKRSSNFEFADCLDVAAIADKYDHILCRAVNIERLIVRYFGSKSDLRLIINPEHERVDIFQGQHFVGYVEFEADDCNDLFRLLSELKFYSLKKYELKTFPIIKKKGFLEEEWN